MLQIIWTTTRPTLVNVRNCSYMIAAEEVTRRDSSSWRMASKRALVGIGERPRLVMIRTSPRPWQAERKG
jgi:hypothetical protein